MSEARIIQDQLQQLYDLSQIDREITKIRSKIGDAPKRREELTHQLEAAEVQMTEKKARTAVLEKEKIGIESEVQFSRDRLMAFESKVNQIKTNKEYQAALKEIAETKNAQKQMEDRVLKLTAELEEIQKDLNEKQQAYELEKQKAEEELKSLAEQETQVAQETHDFEEKRKGMLARLDAGLRAKYEKIQTSRGAAIALVVNGTCQQCNMRIAPQLLIEVQRFTAIHSCPSCYRILYTTGGSS
ncbi:MAG: hypothetical protein HYT76_00665 [Deltaproteobacteria bacterium]|nr:hypothetical protein [Deltaproteobacteria bacterium]